MKKLFFMAFIGLNIATAEESGGFVGLEVGYGEAEIVNIANYIPTFYGGGVAYGFTIGYKQFFTPYFGLRYYANLNLLHANLKPKASWRDTQNSKFMDIDANIVSLNYGANIDFMANVLSSENVDLGGFVGVGLGGDSWLGKGIEHQLWLYQLPNLKLNSKTNFDVWVNVGLRVNFLHYHGIELLARAPLLENKLLDNSDICRGCKITIKGIYSVSMRYTVSF